jgi:hypothetical protein
MANTKLKTSKNNSSVSGFLNSVEDRTRRKDAKAMLSLMADITGEKPAMWGDSIVGFGNYHYRSTSGREGDFLITGFSPRVQSLTLYIMPGYSLSSYQELLAKLGPHSTGKSCLYIKKLDDIHLPTLKKLITRGYRDMKKRYT